MTFGKFVILTKHVVLYLYLLIITSLFYSTFFHVKKRIDIKFVVFYFHEYDYLYNFISFKLTPVIQIIIIIFKRATTSKSSSAQGRGQ